MILIIVLKHRISIPLRLENKARANKIAIGLVRALKTKAIGCVKSLKDLIFVLSS